VMSVTIELTAWQLASNRPQSRRLFSNVVDMTNKDAFDLWWEWAERPVESMPMIDAAIHDAVMALPPDERRDRAKVNEAVRREREKEWR
jgi:hypothetical protein